MICDNTMPSRRPCQCAHDIVENVPENVRLWPRDRYSVHVTGQHGQVTQAQADRERIVGVREDLAVQADNQQDRGVERHKSWRQNGAEQDVGQLDHDGRRVWRVGKIWPTSRFNHVEKNKPIRNTYAESSWD